MRSATNNRPQRPWQKGAAASTVVARPAVLPGVSVSSRSNPSSRTNSPRRTSSSNHNNTNPSSSRRRGGGSISNNNRGSSFSSTKLYTKKDLEEKNKEYEALRARRLNSILPAVRQRENEILVICSDTARLVEEKEIECRQHESESRETYYQKRTRLASLRQNIQDTKTQNEDSKKLKEKLNQDLEKAMNQLQAIREDGECLTELIKKVEDEIKVITGKRDAADLRTKELVMKKEQQKLDTESLRQQYEEAEDDFRIAEQILMEKKAVLTDLQQKINALKKQKKQAFSSTTTTTTTSSSQNTSNSSSSNKSQ